MREFWLSDRRDLAEIAAAVAREFDVALESDSENTFSWHDGRSEREGLAFNISRSHTRSRSSRTNPVRISVSGPRYTEAALSIIGRRLAGCLSAPVTFGTVTYLGGNDFRFEGSDVYVPAFDAAARFLGAFPRSIHNDVRLAIAKLPEALHPPSHDDVGPIVLGDEQIRIPFRVYFHAPGSEPAAFGSAAALVLDCLRTRHHDGHVREDALRRILPHREPWVVPFVVQLAGEYVLEILEVLERQLTPNHASAYREFLTQNEAFLNLTRQRCRSYWNCYYRTQFPRLSDYVASRVLDRFDDWAASDGAA
jgi:hypothetical protein